MPRPVKMNEEEIKSAMAVVPLWNNMGVSIVRELVGENFAVAVGIVNAIAILAEKMNHHPDILIYGWNKVRVKLCTHDQKGLTELDFELAKQIDEMKF